MPENDEVLHVTGLTPTAPAEPEPTPAAPSAPAEVAQPEEQPAASADAPQEPTAQAPAAPTEGDDEAPQEPKKPSRGVQKALDRLTERATRAEESNAQLSSALAAVLAQLKQQPQAATPEPVKEEAPAREKFADWESHNRALAQWEARQAATQVVKDAFGKFIGGISQEQQKQVAQRQAQSLAMKLQEATTKGAERFPDWDDKVLASDAPMSPSLTHAIALSDDPAMVMYHLGSHPQEHAKLMQMSPEQQLYQVGRIIASAQVPPSPSKAPPPAKPIGSTKSTPSTQAYTDEMTPEQHRAYMRKQGADRGLR